MLNWLRRHVLDAEPQMEPPRLTAELGPRRLTFRLHQQTGDGDAAGAGAADWLIVMRETSEDAVVEAMSLSFKLTGREAEVLYWVVKGKINRDIGDILGASPATVKKHLERVYAKLGVETRTAAAGMAMNRIRQLHPEFEAEPPRGTAPKACFRASGYNKRFGNASAFYNEASFTCGFLLKCGASQSPIQECSRCFQCPYSAEPLKHCSISRQALPPTVPNPRLNQSSSRRERGG